MRPKGKGTKNKTITIPLDLNNRIKEIAERKNISFSRFVIQACERAVKDFEDDEVSVK